MVRVAVLLSAILFGLPLIAAEGDQLDADIRMFTVMAAINVAGYDEGLGSPSDSLVRQAVRSELADFAGESKRLLETAYEEWRIEDAGENLAQYVTFALICEPPPTFELRAELPTDLPPEARRLRGLSRILEQFYREADIERLWEKYRPAYEQELDRYQRALAPVFFRAAGYLRLSMSGREALGFKLWIDLLAAPGSVNTRLYGGNALVVAHSAEKIKVEEIQHAFLLHMLDRLSIRHREVVAKKEVLSRFALFAPALDSVYKEDFELLTTKSLVKAVEIRLSRDSQERKAERARRALAEGFILTPYFLEALAKYEADGRDMNRYYPDLIEEIDLKKEAARIQDVKFAEAPSEPKSSTPAPRLSAVDKLLQRGEFLMNEEAFAAAAQAFEQAMEKSGGRNAQASYGLARIAVMQADPEVAREYFTDAAHFAEDPYIKAMAHVYLGRIEDIVGNRELAVNHYQEALKAGDPSDRVRLLAEQGLAAPFQSPRQQSAQEVEDDEDDLDEFEDEPAEAVPGGPVP